MSVLLEKFETLKLSPTEMISAADKMFIEKTEKEYEHLMSNLTQWRTVLEENAKTIPATPTYELLEEHGIHRVEKDYMGERSPGNWYNYHMFTPLFGLKYILDTIGFARARRNDVIVQYFKERYHLRFTESRDILWELESSDRVLEYIIHETGGTSFTEAGIQQILNSVQGNLPEAKLNGAKIIVPEIWLTDGGSKFYSASGARVKELIYGLSYFETGRTEPLATLKEFFDSLEVAAKCVYAGDKFIGLKYYKNRKLELFFSNSEAALDFYSLFKLQPSR